MKNFIKFIIGFAVLSLIIKISGEFSNKSINQYSKQIELYAKTSLNVRDNPGIENKIVKVLKQNEKVTTYDTIVNGFTMILNKNNSILGWVSKKYLQENKIIEIKPSNITKTIVVNSTNKDLETKKILTEYNKLYIELLEFKDKPDFKNLGFSKNGYHKWLKKVVKLKNNPHSKQLLSRGFCVGDLEMLGMTYVENNSKENEYTIYINKVIKLGLTKKIEQRIESTDSKVEINYNELKKNYKLFGRWYIKNNILKEMNMTYEIYQNNNNEYIGVTIEVNYFIEKLIREGNKFTAIGNKFGEYYKIDNELNLKLFNEDGEIDTNQWKASKVN